MVIYGNPLIVNGNIIAKDTPPAVRTFFQEAKPHKQIRNRGLAMGD